MTLVAKAGKSEAVAQDRDRRLLRPVYKRELFLESITRWEDYSRAKDEMFVHTGVAEAPWYVVEARTSGGRAST